MANRPAPALMVRDADRAELERWVRASTLSAGAARRARIVARDIRLNTGNARAGDEAHTLVPRQILTHTGDIHPDGHILTIRLDPLPTARATHAVEQLCEHLTATWTTYPGTQTVIRYEVKPRP